MEQEAVCQPGTYNALAEGDIISRKDIGEPESEQKSSTAPQTPHKIPCRLDYSTPRVRYGGQSTLPLTPDYTPSKSSKREFKYALEDLSFYPQPAKRRHTDPQRSTPRSLLRQGSLLKISKMHHPETPEQVPFSADEMKRTCEAVLSQIDWNDVQEYVASNRSTASYKKAMKSVLQAEVSKLFQEEDNSDNGSTD